MTATPLLSLRGVSKSFPGVHALANLDLDLFAGEVLTIVNPEPQTPLTPEEYPPGKLIELTDPSSARPN